MLFTSEDVWIMKVIGKVLKFIFFGNSGILDFMVSTHLANHVALDTFTH